MANMKYFNGDFKMKRTSEFYEVRTRDDRHGLSILPSESESKEKVLEAINKSYEYAKARGYDNKDNKWIIVCNQIVKEFDDKGMFLKEECSRFVVENVEYSDYENAFVFVY